jgi:hypothetical protein
MVIVPWLICMSVSKIFIVCTSHCVHFSAPEHLAVVKHEEVDNTIIGSPPSPIITGFAQPSIVLPCRSHPGFDVRSLHDSNGNFTPAPIRSYKIVRLQNQVDEDDENKENCGVDGVE